MAGPSPVYLDAGVFGFLAGLEDYGAAFSVGSGLVGSAEGRGWVGDNSPVDARHFGINRGGWSQSP